MPPPWANALIFLLIGQSNMFGTATYDFPFPDTNGRVWSIDPVSVTWQVASDPLHYWLSGSASKGPGMPFARQINQLNRDANIIILPCAHPGRIMGWQKGALPTSVSTGLPDATAGLESNYGRCLRMIREALPYGTMAGVIMYQGEADTDVSAGGAGSLWHLSYQQMITDIRQDLRLPNLAAVHAQLATTTCGGPDWALVKASQASVVIPRTTMVQMDDIAMDHVADCIHHTTAGFTEVGKRLANAWWTLTNQGVDL